MSHLAKFPRACHQSAALSEEQVEEFVRRRRLAQHAGAWASTEVLSNYVDITGEMYYVDKDMLLESEDEEWSEIDSEEDAETEPMVPRLLPPPVYMFDESTCSAWQAQMTQQVIPALQDAPGSGMYGYVVHVSSPFLPVCEAGCACEKGNRACHFIVRNNQTCTVSNILVPKNVPLYMCAAGCVIMGPVNDSLSPPIYVDNDGKHQTVADTRWVRIANKEPYRVHYERFGVGDMRCAWEAVAPSNNSTTDKFINQVVGTHMGEPFVREAVYRYVQQHPEEDEQALGAKIMSNPIAGKKIMVKVGHLILRAAT